MSTNVATMDRPAQQITPLQEARGQLDSMESQFRLALPAHIPAERFVRVVLTAVGANQDLLTKCSRTSLLAAAMKSAQDGLLPDGREAALIPFNGVVQYLPMVAGILKKVRNSGQLSTIVARVVYAGDKFRNWIDDDGEHIEYEAADDQDRSIVRRVFAMAKLKDGSVEVEVLQPADIEKIRNVSRAKSNGPWVSWWDQMAQKSAIRRLAKRLPISTDLDDLIRRDDDLYDLRGARDEAQIANGGRPQSLAGRLDILAKMPERQGLIQDDAGGSEAQDQAAAPAANEAPANGVDASSPGDAASSQSPPSDAKAPNADDAADDTGEPETPRDILIARLRREVIDGKSAPSLLNALNDQERALLTDDDRKSLRDMGKAIAAKKGSDG